MWATRSVKRKGNPFSIIRYGEDIGGLSWNPFRLHNIGEVGFKDKRKDET